MKTACAIARLSLLVLLTSRNRSKETQQADLDSSAAAPATTTSTPNTGIPAAGNAANQKNLLAFGAGVTFSSRIQRQFPPSALTA